MSGNNSDYGTMLLNAKEENDRDASELNHDAAMVNFCNSFGCRLSKDGSEWCLLLGDNLTEGHAFFAKNPRETYARMMNFLKTGKIK